MSNTTCKNCGKLVDSNYCKHCGQRTTVGKITFKETLQDFIDMVFSVNAPLMLTLKLLIINPGKLFREYLSGKRKKYYKPVAFLILNAVIYVFIRSILGYDPMRGLVNAQFGDEQLANLFISAGEYMSHHSNNIVFVFVFTLSLSLKLFFSKKYLWAEYLAISFYIIGLYMLFMALMVFILRYLNPNVRMLPLVCLIFYTLYAILSFFRSKNIWMIVKIICSSLLALILYMIFGFGLSFLIVWLNS